LLVLPPTAIEIVFGPSAALSEAERVTTAFKPPKEKAAGDAVTPAGSPSTVTASALGAPVGPLHCTTKETLLPRVIDNVDGSVKSTAASGGLLSSMTPASVLGPAVMGSSAVLPQAHNPMTKDTAENETRGRRVAGVMMFGMLMTMESTAQRRESSTIDGLRGETKVSRGPAQWETLESDDGLARDSTLSTP
jgi:hypothetical protein